MAAARAPLALLLAAVLLARGAVAAAAAVAKPATSTSTSTSTAAPEDSATTAAPPDGSTAAAAAAAPADMASFMNECNASFPTDTKLLSELNNSGSFRDETQEKPMCFLHCVFLKSGLVDDEGTFNAQRVRAAYGAAAAAAAAAADDAVASCILQRDETEHCRRVYAFVSCLMTEEIIRFGTPVNRGNRRAPQFS